MAAWVLYLLGLAVLAAVGVVAWCHVLDWRESHRARSLRRLQAEQQAEYERTCR